MVHVAAVSGELGYLWPSLRRAIQVLQDQFPADQGPDLHLGQRRGYHHPARLHPLHLTLTGGFLASAEFISPHTVDPAAQCLTRGFFGPLHHKSDMNCMYLFIDAFEIALLNGRMREAIDSWDVAQKPLLLAALADLAFKRAAKTIWDNFLQAADAPKRCPCGEQKEGTLLADHVKESHYPYLY